VLLIVETLLCSGVAHKTVYLLKQVECGLSMFDVVHL